MLRANFKHPHIATLIGYIALLLWSFAGVYWKCLTRLPTGEVLMLIFSIAALPALYHCLMTKQWQNLLPPLPYWFSGCIGVYGVAVSYFQAVKYAPIAHVELIMYLWPLMAIAFSSLLPEEKLSCKYFLAVCVGLLGIYLLLTHDNIHPSWHYVFGYVIAGINALLWCVFSLFSRLKQQPKNIIGFYFIFGTLLAGIHHLAFEQTIMPTHVEWFVLLLMGLTTQFAAYYCWLHGFKHGNHKLLSLLAYGNPILSISFLILFGFAKPTNTLLFSAVAISAACFIASYEPRRRRALTPRFLSRLSIQARHE